MTKLIVAFRNFSKARKAEGRRTFNELPVGITVDFLKGGIFLDIRIEIALL
jgi:hypothetical protein